MEEQKLVEVKISRLAIAACALGILSVIGGFTAVPAIILGIVGAVIIATSGGRVTGKGFAVIGIAIPAVVLTVAMGACAAEFMCTEQIAIRRRCGANLSALGKAMLVYANDYDDRLPRAGGSDPIWGRTVWNAVSRSLAYNDNGTTSCASISSCFYLLVKYMDVAPKTFICSGDKGTSTFNLADEMIPGNLELTDAWDFGSRPKEHCSYSYHHPFSSFPLSLASDPAMAVASERNPWLDSPGAVARTGVDFDCFIPDIPEYGGDRQTAILGNALTHEGDGQNVLFLDGHVEFAERSFCGLERDNIFLLSMYVNTGDARGILPFPSTAFNITNAKDSCLLHDVENIIVMSR